MQHNIDTPTCTTAPTTVVCGGLEEFLKAAVNRVQAGCVGCIPKVWTLDRMQHAAKTTRMWATPGWGPTLTHS